jgi:hypothetical protein
MVDEEWFDTDELIDRLPASRRILRRVVAMGREGKRDLPESIPLHQAVALAAAAQASARGRTRVQPVFDAVRLLGDEQAKYLIVIPGRGKPQVVRADGFEPVPAIVIDLAELRRAIPDGKAIIH